MIEKNRAFPGIVKNTEGNFLFRVPEHSAYHDDMSQMIFDGHPRK